MLKAPRIYWRQQ